jgi:quercetin dioxygenase-like cupin family protein
LRLRPPPREKWVRDILLLESVSWIDEPGGKLKRPSSREYETIGYVIAGSAKLDIEGQPLNLKRGDSWLVPAGAMHQYTIIEPFTAVEATAPPAEVHGRDTPE